MKVTEISKVLVQEGYTKRVDCRAYWDAHGKVIPWEGSKVFKYPELKKFELYRVKQLWESEYLKPYEAELLHLYIDGVRLIDIGEITCVEELKTKLKLDCCVGAG